MVRRPTLTAVALAALGSLALADAAAAQASPQSPAPRHLSWQGRPEVQPVVSQAPTRRANPVIPHGGSFARATPPPGLTPAPGGTPGRLTPANAWLRPAPAPEAAQPVPPPPSAPPPAPRPAPQPPVVVAAPPIPVPDFLPDRGGQPAPSTVTQPDAPRPAAEVGTDPMAPRRDAPIFRMQQTVDAAPAAVEDRPDASSRPAARPAPVRTASVAPNAADRPPVQGARYYSVHRQNGQQPDAVVMPEPNYVDAMTMTLPETPASQDLAEPDRGPTLIRDAQGRTRAAPAASDGDHQ